MFTTLFQRQRRVVRKVRSRKTIDRRSIPLCLESLEDREMLSTLAILSESGSSGYTFSGTFTYWNGAVLPASGSDTQSFGSGSGFYSPYYASGGASVGYDVHHRGGDSYWFGGNASLSILSETYGPNTFDGNASGSGAVFLRIEPDDLDEQFGDPVYVDGEVDSSVDNGGAASASLTPFSGPGRHVAYIGDTLGASIDFYVNLAGTNAADTITASAAITVKYSLTPAPLPDITLEHVTWDTTGRGGADVSYSVQNTPLRSPTSIAVYWSATSDEADIIGEPITTFLSKTATGTYVEALPQSVFASPPPDARQLIVIADPNDTVRESHELNNVAAVLRNYPDLKWLSLDWNTRRGPEISTPESPERGLDFGYVIEHDNLPRNTEVKFYWAMGPEFQDRIGGALSSQDLVGTEAGKYGAVFPLNEPARWGPAPEGATHILMALDPEDLIEESDETNNVKALPIHTEREILEGAIRQNLTNDGITLELTFLPGSGESGELLTLSEAEVVLGVEHFNWLQWVTSIPDTWKAETIYDLDHSRGISKRNGVLYYEDTKMPVKSKSINTPFLDFIVSSEPRDTRAFWIDIQSDGVQDGFIHWSLPNTYPHDAYWYYLNERVAPALNLFAIQRFSYPDRLLFEDTPRQTPLDSGESPFSNASRPYLSFSTTLVGVNYDDVQSYRTWTAKGYNLTVQWKSNTEVDGTGTVFDVVAAGQGATLTSAVRSGGVFDVQTSDDAIPISVAVALPLGTVDLLALPSLNLFGGDLWYLLASAHEAILTLESPSPAAQIALFNGELDELAVSQPGEHGQRLDWPTPAGQSFYVRLSGTGENVDLRIANLVQRDGDIVKVYGTDAADQFTFDASAAPRIAINGVEYAFAESDATLYSFDGLGGIDDVLFVGSDGADTAKLYPHRAMFSGNGHTVTAVNIESSTFDGGAQDVAFLYGTHGANTFTAGGAGPAADPRRAVLMDHRTGFTATATSEEVYVDSRGGKDNGLFVDPTGTGTLESFWREFHMRGSGYSHRVRSISNVAEGLGVNATDFPEATGFPSYADISANSDVPSLSAGEAPATFSNATRDPVVLSTPAWLDELSYSLRLNDLARTSSKRPSTTESISAPSPLDWIFAYWK